MCVRTHVLFNSYLMYVNHFNIFLIPEACSVTYTLLYIGRRFMLPIIYMKEVYAYLWVMDSARIIVLDGRTDTPLHS